MGADGPPRRRRPTGHGGRDRLAAAGEGSGVSDPDPTDDVLPEMRVADAIQHVDQDLYGGYVIAKLDRRRVRGDGRA